MTTSLPFTVSLPPLQDLVALSGVAAEITRSLNQIDLGMRAVQVAAEQLRQISAVQALSMSRPLVMEAITAAPPVAVGRLLEEVQATVAKSTRPAMEAAAQQAVASLQTTAAMSARVVLESATQQTMASVRAALDVPAAQAATALRGVVEASALQVAVTLREAAAAHQLQVAETLRGIAALQTPAALVSSVPASLLQYEQGLGHLLHLGREAAAAHAAWHIHSLERAREHRLCAQAERAVHDDDREVLLHFTTEGLRLPGHVHAYVAEVLWQGRWRYAEHPLAYIRRAAWRTYQSAEHGRTKARANRPTAVLSMEQVTIGDESLGDILPDPYDPLPAVELRIDLERACAQLGVPADVCRLLWARMHGVTRVEASMVLGWAPQRVESAWRWVSRNRERLVNILQLLPYSCPRTAGPVIQGK